LDLAWQQVLGRLPTTSERDKASTLSLDQICLALLNTNEFLYLD
jgi:hypothetical protein